MLPPGVESKVEQYLNINWRQPCACSHFSAARDCTTASPAGIDRLFRATTPASISSGAGVEGTPRNWAVRKPPCPGSPLASVLPISLAPVKSSAITPSSIIQPRDSAARRGFLATTGASGFALQSASLRSAQPRHIQASATFPSPASVDGRAMLHMALFRRTVSATRSMEGLDKQICRCHGIGLRHVSVDDQPDASAFRRVDDNSLG